MVATLAAAVFAAAALGTWWLHAPRRLASASAARSNDSVMRWASPVGAALAVMVLFDGVTALVLALAVGVGLYRWRAGAESPHDRGLQVQRALSLPVALDILAACFAVGANQRDALDAVARSVGGTLEGDLRVVSGAMHVGADVREAWSLIDAPDLQALSAVLARAEVTGAPVTPLLAVLADQHRQRARMVAMDAARALGVRVAGPLGLCFLPAFVAVAVIPLVISLLPFSW